MKDETIYFEPGAAARLGGYAWEETVGTLRAGQDSGDCMPTIVSVESNQSDARMKIRDDGTVQTLLGRMGTGGNNIPLVGESWDGSQTAPTLTVNNANGAQRMPDKDNFNAVLAVDGYNQSAGDVTKSLTSIRSDSDHVPIAAGRYIVRRLTPMGCERLQGFPDQWTDIGEWVDSKGKKRQTTDSARYKALGNSIAVGYANEQRGFWMWLMKRISAQYERTATLGSLFDGICGFPLAWATYNGPENCLWSSEIEEFCIAVAKKHFGDGETEGDVNEYLRGAK